MQDLPIKERSILLPNLQFLDPGVSALVLAHDYKRRDRARPGVRLVLPAGPSGADSLPPALRRMIYDAALSGLRFRDVTLVSPGQPAEMADFPGPRSVALLANLDADAVVSVTLETFDEHKGGAELMLRDPVDGQILGQRRLLFSIDAGNTRNGKEASGQAEFFIDGRSVRTIRDRSALAVRLELPPAGALRQLVDRAVTGTLSVLATAPGATVFVRADGNRRRIGSAPVRSIRLAEGRAIVEVIRRGYEPFVREVQIRAGRESRVQAAWPGDARVGSLAVLSSPPGLRVAMDGVIRGETPAFLTDMQEGTYGLELSAPGPLGPYIIQADGKAQVGKVDSERLGFFIRYEEAFSGSFLDSGLWQLAVEDGTVQYAPRGGLGLSGKGTTGGWRGLASVPVLPEDTVIQLDAVQAAGTEFAFALIGRNESVVLELGDNRWSMTRFRGRDAVTPRREFKALREGNAHRLEFDYLELTSQLTVSFDGTVLFQGHYNPGASFRIAMLTRGASIDGRALAQRIKIRSGRGLVEE